jgi:FkbM family methyltransferase
MLWYSTRYEVYKWKNIEGVFIPVSIKYGYSVLRFIDNGEYERSEISIIKNTLDKEDLVLELGTGIGFVSAYCAKQIGSDRIFTFEGNPSLKPLIQKLYSKNKVMPHSTIALLGNENGSKTFYKNENSFLASSAISNPDENQESFQVEQKKLNEIITQLQPTYLVMDIEGGEFDIFKLIDFQSITKIQFELHPAILKTEKINFIFEKLQKEGFVKSNLFNFSNNFYFTKAI